MVLVEDQPRELVASSVGLMEASWVAATVIAYADYPMLLLVAAQTALGCALVVAALAPGKEVALAVEQGPPFLALPLAGPLVLEGRPLLAMPAILGELVGMLLRTHSATGPHRMKPGSWLQPRHLPLRALEELSS